MLGFGNPVKFFRNNNKESLNFIFAKIFESDMILKIVIKIQNKHKERKR